jgi:hypothetical protein
MAGGISKYSIAITSRLPDDLGWFFVISQANELGVPQMIGSSPLEEIDPRHGLWLEPQCRMPDYGAWGVVSLLSAASITIFVPHNQTEDSSASAPECG